MTNRLPTRPVTEEYKKEVWSPTRGHNALLVGLNLLTVISSLFLGMLLLKMTCLKNTGPVQQHWCIPTSKIGKCFGNDGDKLNDLNGRCCGDRKTILDLLVRQSLQKTLELWVASKILTDQNCEQDEGPVAVANLRGINTRHTEESDNGIVRWHERSNMSVRQEVGHKDGVLHVKQPGYYFVYCQTKYKRRAQEGNGGKNVIHQQLYRRSTKHGTIQLLLESLETGCDEVTDDDVTTMSSGTVSYLHHGDAVFLQTSQANNLLTSDLDCVFGLYMI